MIAAVPTGRIRSLFFSLGNMLASMRKHRLEFPAEISSLRLALVADTFTADGLAPECEVALLTPASWKPELERIRPHLLLVESCWHGVRGEWRGLVQSASTTLRRLVSYCRGRGIPTVFWAKEDPTHWQDFLSTAALFDWVLTTDAECVPRYMQALGHRRVAVLPFAIQPRLHHPISTNERGRLPGTMFAGAWYENFPKRCAEFSVLAEGLSHAGPFHIYRRPQPDGQLADYPAKYAQHIRPGIPYAMLGDAYRSYEIGLTINTVTDSPTMFARRAIELLGCGTKVVSNRCRAIELQFGKLVESCMDETDAEAAGRAWLASIGTEAYRDWRARAVRVVHSRYDWKSRLADLVGFLDPAARADLIRPPRVSVIARASNASEADRIRRFVDAQVGVEAELWLQADASVLPARSKRIDVASGAAPPTQLFGSETLIAPLHSDDWYGPYYLHDLTLGMRFGLGRVVGKGSYLASEDGRLIRVAGDQEYRLVRSLALRRLLFHAAGWNGSVANLLDGIENGTIDGAGLVSIDGLSYIENGGQGPEPTSLEQGGHA